MADKLPAMRRLMLFCLFLLAAGPAAAQAPPSLSFPADCRIGGACWILSFVDLDSAQAYTDHRCGTRTYAGHKGTDIALIDPRAIADGIRVLAAADGTVLGVRDGEPDNPMGRDPSFVQGKECGNGVRIDHGGGWATQYCHLRRGSIAVAGGQRVRAGDPLGRIGNSGASETPHLHFQLDKDGTILDPFLGRGADSPVACGLGAPLWTDEALAAFGPYEPTFIRHAGFAPRPVEIREVQATPAPDTLPRDAEALIFYATVYGAPAGSIVSLDIEGPDGTSLVAQSFDVPDAKARKFNFIGRKTPPGGWPSGVYSGVVTVRAGGESWTRREAVTVR